MRKRVQDFDELAQRFAGCRWCRIQQQEGEVSEVLKGGAQLPRALGTNLRKELEGPKCCHLITRILDPSQDRENVADVRSLQEFLTTVLDVRDLSAHEFAFQLVGVVACSYEDGLVGECPPGLAIRQYLFDHVGGFICERVHTDEPRRRAAVSMCRQCLAEALGGVGEHVVCHVQNGLHGAIVPLERNDLGGWLVLPRKVQDVFDRGSTKRVDRLGFITDHRHATSVGLEQPQDVSLQPIRVLELIDEDEIEPVAHRVGDRAVCQEQFPIQQQVVEVEHVRRAFGVDIGAKQVPKVVDEREVMGEPAREHVL